MRSSAYGLRACPPRADQPLEACVERKFAHSLRFVLPSTIAPAARSRSTTNASRVGRAVDERERAGGGVHPVGGVDVVLHEHGDAVQRTARLARSSFRVERRGDGERVGVRLEHGMQRRSACDRATRCAAGSCSTSSRDVSSPRASAACHSATDRSSSSATSARRGRSTSSTRAWSERGAASPTRQDGKRVLRRSRRRTSSRRKRAC